MAQTQKAPASVGPISSFAHLAGALAAKADNDKDEKDDEEDRKKDEKGDEESKKSKKASAEEEEAACDDGDDEPQKKGKKAKAAKEKDTSDDDEHYDDDKAEHARHAERARIHAIMTCIGASHAWEEAVRLSFKTDVSAEQAIGHLNVKAIEMLSANALKPAPKADALRDRMASEPQPDIGAGIEGGGTGDAYQDQVRATAASIVAAGKKRRGEKA